MSRVAAGREVTIAKAGREVARLVPIEAKPRTLTLPNYEAMRPEIVSLQRDHP